MSVQARELVLHLTVPEWVPTHGVRKSASAEFEKNRQQIIDDGFGYCLGCAIAGIHNTTDLQCHHFAVEWCEAENADWEAALVAAKLIDPYGYAAKMGDTPMVNEDDIRNLMLLCQPCHTGKPGESHPNIAKWLSGGIHYTTFVAWMADRVSAGKEEKEAAELKEGEADD